MPRRFVCCLITCCLVGATTASPAHAEDQPSAAYQSALSEALEDFDAGRYAEARALFRRAHAEYPNARTLRGIGMASFELRDYVAALTALEGALEHETRPLTEEQREAVKDLISRTSAFVNQYEILLDPPDASLRVNGGLVELAPGNRLILGFGKYTLEASCSTCKTERRTIDVSGGKLGQVHFKLDRSEVAASPPPVEPADAAMAPSFESAPPEPEDERPNAAKLGWYGAAGAGAVAVGTGIWWALRQGELSDCRDANATPGMACLNEDALESERNVALTSTIVFGAAAVAFAVIGALATDGDADDLACAPGPGTVTCRITY